MSQQIARHIGLDEQRKEAARLRALFFPPQPARVYRPQPKPATVLVMPVPLPAPAEPEPFKDTGRPTPERTIARVAREHGLKSSDITGQGRTKKATTARRAAIVAVRAEFPDLSYELIGVVFGCRDHSTIIHSLARSGAWTPSRTQERPKTWLPEHEQILRELWPTKMVAAEIGARIGKTKPAVIAKALRLGLPGRVEGISAAERERRNKERWSYSEVERERRNKARQQFMQRLRDTEEAQP